MGHLSPEGNRQVSLTIPVSNRIGRLVQSLTAEVPNIETTVENYGPTLRITTLTHCANSAEQVHLIEMVGEINVQFGHGLVYEFDPTDQDLNEIKELVRRLIFDGYEESVRVRRGKIVRSEVSLEIAGRPRRTSIRGPLPLWGSTRDHIKHQPWT